MADPPLDKRGRPIPPYRWDRHRGYYRKYCEYKPCWATRRKTEIIQFNGDPQPTLYRFCREHRCRITFCDHMRRIDPRLSDHQQGYCAYHACAEPGCDDPSAAAEKHEKLDDRSRFCAQHTPPDPPPTPTQPPPSGPG